VHPEVSFAEMAQRPLDWSKKSWNGSQLRRGLLREQGIDLPDTLPDVGAAGVDDVLDAAAAAWSADRIACGLAVSLPSPPQVIDGRPVAIWV
jgi:predicted RNase H-like nuclease